jgi:hypothetical protein
VKKKKATYRIRNWKEYNRALKQRGSLTIWLSQEATENWTTEEKSGQRGPNDKYTRDGLICCVVTTETL